MEKMSKDELQIWAGVFAQHICRGVGTGGDVKFINHAYNNGESMTAAQLAARINTIDPELSKRFLACFSATEALGTYIGERLEVGKR